MKATISDSDRREVAQELRRQAAYEDGSLGEWWQRLQDTVTGEVDFPNPEKTFERLADLIDRPTTRVDINKHGRTYCVNCGCDDWILADGAKYCPNCGAEVVE